MNAEDEEIWFDSQGLRDRAQAVEGVQAPEKPGPFFCEVSVDCQPGVCLVVAHADCHDRHIPVPECRCVRCARAGRVPPVPPPVS